MSICTWRDLPPNGYGIAAPGTVTRRVRIVFMRALVVNQLAVIDFREQKFADAGARFDKALELLRFVNDPKAKAAAYTGRGGVDVLAGRLDAATAEMGQARLLHEMSNDAYGMHEDDAVSRGRFRLRHRAHDAVQHVRHARIVRDRRIRRPMAGNENRHALVVAAPVIDLLDRAPPHEYRARRIPLVPQFAQRTGWPREIAEPFMQAVEPCAARVIDIVVRTRDVAVERHGHEEHGAGHSRSPIVECEDDAFRNIELDRAATLDPMTTGRHAPSLADRVPPRLAIERQRAATATVVVSDDQVSAAVVRRRNRSAQVAVVAARQRQACSQSHSNHRKRKLRWL